MKNKISDYLRRSYLEKALLFSLLIFLSSCSTRAYLGYNPVYPITEPKGASIAFSKIDDIRPRKDVIGGKLNSYGMPVVTIYVDNSVSDWATEALKKELGRAGYSLENLDKEKNLEIQGTLKKAYATSYVNYRGKIVMCFTVYQNSKLVFDKTYQTSLRNGINFAGRTHKIVKALERNLQAVYAEFINDLEKI